jgi:hypothetical protein
MMLILTVLAAYAIAQRVWQYGWTPMRLRSAMVTAIALVYSAGYSRAAARKGDWLRGIEPVNVAASLGIVAVLALKLTPVADPARISVNSQVARLTGGTLAPAKFDYQFLRFDAGRYGKEALAALTHSHNTDMAARASLALAAKSRSYSAPGATPDSSLTEAPLAHAAIYPRGETLPDSFRQTKWSDDDGSLPDCLKNGSSCDIILLPHKEADAPMLLIIERFDKAGGDQAVEQAARIAADAANSSAPVYGRDAGGAWRRVGALHMIDCPGVAEALRHGAAMPVRPLHDDLMVDGLRLSFSSEMKETCPLARLRKRLRSCLRAMPRPLSI